MKRLLAIFYVLLSAGAGFSAPPPQDWIRTGTGLGVSSRWSTAAWAGVMNDAICLSDRIPFSRTAALATMTTMIIAIVVGSRRGVPILRGG